MPYTRPLLLVLALMLEPPMALLVTEEPAPPELAQLSPIGGAELLAAAGVLSAATEALGGGWRAWRSSEAPQRSCWRGTSSSSPGACSAVLAELHPAR